MPRLGSALDPTLPGTYLSILLNLTFVFAGIRGRAERVFVGASDVHSGSHVCDRVPGADVKEPGVSGNA